MGFSLTSGLATGSNHPASIRPIFFSAYLTLPIKEHLTSAGRAELTNYVLSRIAPVSGTRGERSCPIRWQ